MQTSELIGRLEAATGPDRHLGRAVLLACGKGYVSPLYRWLDPTASIDAALTLVPEGWTLFHLDGPWNSAPCHATVANGVFCEGEGATPALAICIASLKARP